MKTRHGSMARWLNEARWLRGSSLLLALGAASACGGTQTETTEPDGIDLLDNEPDPPKEVPASPEVKQARAAIQGGDFERAKEILEDALKQAPDDPQAQFYYAVALEGVGRLTQAEQAYERTIQLSPELIEAYQNLSALLLSKETPTEETAIAASQRALEVTEAGLEKEPEDGGLLANRAMALDLLGNTEAVSAYEEALAVIPENDDVRFNYAVVLAMNERPEDAKAQLAKIETKDPTLLVEVAQVAARLSDFELCIGALNRAIQTGSQSAEIYVRRGVCQHGAGQDDAAMKDLRKAVELEPKSALAHYYLGRHLAMKKQDPEARKHLEQAAALGQGTPLEQQARNALQELH